jgi:hypothetical protein
MQVARQENRRKGAAKSPSPLPKLKKMQKPS